MVVKFDEKIHKKIKGGFVLKEAYFKFCYYHRVSRRANSGRSLIARLFKPKYKPLDLAHDDAIDCDRKVVIWREAEIVRKSIPDELWSKLNKIKFKGLETTTYNGVRDVEASGIKNAIWEARNAGGFCNYNDDSMDVVINYKDEETEVNVSGWINGWGTAEPAICIIHKGIKYKWSDGRLMV